MDELTKTAISLWLAAAMATFVAAVKPDFLVNYFTAGILVGFAISLTAYRVSKQKRPRPG